MRSLNQVERELTRVAERITVGETSGDEHVAADEYLIDGLRFVAADTEDESQVERIIELYRRATGRAEGGERPSAIREAPGNAGIPIEPA